MLSRSETVVKLIKIRKDIKKREEEIDEPDNFHNSIKNKIDNLLLEIIGVPEEGQYEIRNVLNKAICGEIKARTAVVALHEIYREYLDSENSLEENETILKNDLEELYKNGYR